MLKPVAKWKFALCIKAKKNLACSVTRSTTLLFSGYTRNSSLWLDWTNFASVLCTNIFVMYVCNWQLLVANQTLLIHYFKYANSLAESNLASNQTATCFGSILLLLYALLYYLLFSFSIIIKFRRSFALICAHIIKENSNENQNK